MERNLDQLAADTRCAQGAYFEVGTTINMMKYERLQALKKVAAEARRLATYLTREAESIEARGVEAHPNSLGIMQGNAAEMDRACAQAAVLATMIQQAEAIVKAGRS
ncbi:MAG TPA: hypothetical protein VIV56_16830 [Gemmatimonadales bacterium]